MRSLQKRLLEIMDRGIVPYYSSAHKFLQILCKQAEARKPHQIEYLREYIPSDDLLNQLAQRVSLEFVMNLLMKHSRLVYGHEESVVAEEGDKIQSIFLCLAGCVMADKKRCDRIDQEHIYRLSLVANAELRNNTKLRKAQSTNQKITSQQSDICPFPRDHFEPQQYPHKTRVVGLHDRCHSPKHTSRYVLAQDALLIEIPVGEFFTALHYACEDRIRSIQEKIERLPCFKGLEPEKLGNFIMNLTEVTQKRGGYVYRQNEPAEKIYFLTQGQVRLSKQSSLLVENPNELYTNRVSLLLDEPSLSKSQDRYHPKQSESTIAESVLPYADLSRMYNFSPKKKTVEISLLSPFCMFGTEELIENKPRQTNAICHSLEVKYLEISFSQAKEVLGLRATTTAQFLRGFRQESRDKVLQRQAILAKTIDLENRSTMNYFYSSEAQEVSPSKKFRISKINKKIQGDEQPKLVRFESLDHNTPPRYTTFNFNKMITPVNPERRPDQLATSAKRHQMQSESDDEVYTSDHTKQEMRVMAMTHTWKLIKGKVEAQAAKSKQLSPIKQSMYIFSKLSNVYEPLIDSGYLAALDLQKKKLERKIRRDKITVCPPL